LKRGVEYNIVMFIITIFKNTDTPIQFDAESDAINPKTLVSGNVTIDHCYVYYNLIENLEILQIITQ